MPDIDAILANEDDTEIIAELDEYINDKSDYGENIDNLSRSEKIVLFVGNLEREVNNGGFAQFFFNSSGDFAHETVTALETIGASHTAALLINAISRWPKQHVPGDTEKRQSMIDNVEKSAGGYWASLDEQFYDYEDDITALLLDFIKKHRSDFR